jgi:hypothetical protein
MKNRSPQPASTNLPDRKSRKNHIGCGPSIEAPILCPIPLVPQIRIISGKAPNGSRATESRRASRRSSDRLYPGILGNAPPATPTMTSSLTEEAPVSVEVGGVDGVGGGVVVVVGGAAFYRVDLEEPAQGGDHHSGAHLDRDQRAKVFGRPLVLTEPPVVQTTLRVDGIGVSV